MIKETTEKKKVNVQEKSKVLEKYEVLNEGLKAVSSGTLPLLVLRGSAGWGKSYITKEYLSKNKISSKYISTYSTALAFYKILYENKDKSVIVFDDLCVEDKKIMAILKGCCNNIVKEREVMWNSTSDLLAKYELPDKFKLNSNIILILNKDYTDFLPVINRAMIIDFDFKFDEKVEILEDFKEKAGIDEDILNYVRLNCDTCDNNLSIRTAVNLSTLKNKGYRWEKFAKEMFKPNEDLVLLKQLVSKYRSIKCAEKEWCKQTGHSRATFYRKKKRFK